MQTLEASNCALPVTQLPNDSVVGPSIVRSASKPATEPTSQNEEAISQFETIMLSLGQPAAAPSDNPFADGLVLWPELPIQPEEPSIDVVDTRVLSVATSVASPDDSGSEPLGGPLIEYSSDNSLPATTPQSTIDAQYTVELPASRPADNTYSGEDGWRTETNVSAPILSRSHTTINNNCDSLSSVNSAGVTSATAPVLLPSAATVASATPIGLDLPAVESVTPPIAEKTSLPTNGAVRPTTNSVAQQPAGAIVDSPTGQVLETTRSTALPVASDEVSVSASVYPSIAANPTASNAEQANQDSVQNPTPTPPSFVGLSTEAASVDKPASVNTVSPKSGRLRQASTIVNQLSSAAPAFAVNQSLAGASSIELDGTVSTIAGTDRISLPVAEPQVTAVPDAAYESQPIAAVVDQIASVVQITLLESAASESVAPVVPAESRTQLARVATQTVDPETKPVEDGRNSARRNSTLTRAAEPTIAQLESTPQLTDGMDSILQTDHSAVMDTASLANNSTTFDDALINEQFDRSANLFINGQSTRFRTSFVAESLHSHTSETRPPDTFGVSKQIGAAIGPALNAEIGQLKGGTRVQLKLDPANLGQIQVDLRADQSQIKVQIVAEKWIAHSIIEQHIDNLIAALGSDGTHSVEIDLSHRGDGHSDGFGEQERTPNESADDRKASAQDQRTNSGGELANEDVDADNKQLLNMVV